jgi:AraC-like DNA-binding protein
MNYVDSHIYTLKSLKELGVLTGYNYNYASNVFKAVTGETLLNYYRSKRLKTARLLLNEGKLSVSELSTLLNYSSVYAFSRAFKDKYGVSPTKDTYIGKSE